MTEITLKSKSTNFYQPPPKKKVAAVCPMSHLPVKQP